jgi:hypothetical protein
MNFGTKGCMYNCGDSCTGECMTEFKPEYLEALSMQAGHPVYTTNPFTGGEFKPRKSVVERYGKSIIKKGKLNYDQTGRAYPDNPEVKENWDCIWEKDGKHYKLVGDNEHKEWEEVRPSNETLYSEIEHLIIRWTIDGTKTAGSLTRDIMKLIENKDEN